MNTVNQSGASAPTRALAAFAFGSHSQIADTSRPLAWLSPEEMDIDLADPEQRRFGDYELVEKIGQGGMGVVYRARQLGLERDVAFKLLAAGPWASEEFVERFRREARSAARMQHPNIVEIYEFGHRDGLNYFSMRLVEGQSLAERLAATGPLEPRAAARLLRTLAEAMDYAHRLGVLHLDLKPGNVLLTPEGEPLIADFGLARRIDAGHEGGEIAGTPSYMAPEQAVLESHPLTASTDIWGLGAILYECLTGRPPFLAPDAQRTLQRVVADSPAPPREMNRAIPADLEAICLKCLRKDPGQRYASARELGEDLRRQLEGELVSARVPDTWERAQRWVKRNQAASGMIAVVLIGIASSTWQAWRADQARGVAESRRVQAEAARGEAQSQRERAESRELRAQRASRMMAAMLGSGDDASHRKAQADALVDWLDRELPGDDSAQAEQVRALSQALIDSGRIEQIGDLLQAVHERLGRQFHRRALDLLMQRDDAASLAQSLVLAHGLDLAGLEADAKRADLAFTRALALAPEDPRIVEFAAHLCELRPQRDCVELYRHFAAVRPDNAMPWVFLAISQREDRAALRQALIRAGQADFMDDGYRAMLKAQGEGLKASGLTVPAAVWAPLEAMRVSDDPWQVAGSLSAAYLSIPSYIALTRPCDPLAERLDDALRAACQRLAWLLVESSGGLLPQAIGWNMLRRLLPGSAIEQDMIQRRRQYLWGIHAYDLALQQGRSDVRERLVEDWIAHGELEGFLRRIEYYGFPRQPPEDFLPPGSPGLELPPSRAPR